MIGRTERGFLRLFTLTDNPDLLRAMARYLERGQQQGSTGNLSPAAKAEIDRKANAVLGEK